MENERLLLELENKIKKDESVLLKKSANNLVFGKGNPNSNILFVGEAPGKNEDLEGKPFVGAAGKNLDSLLKKAGLSLDEIYVTNILKYRPPENREPSPEEIKNHSPFLLGQIEIIRPKIICSLGNYATKFFLSGGDVEKMKLQPGITQMHGKVQSINFRGIPIKLVPLFHPAAIIYNHSLIFAWEKDIEIVKTECSQSFPF